LIQVPKWRLIVGSLELEAARTSARETNWLVDSGSEMALNHRQPGNTLTVNSVNKPNVSVGSTSHR